MTHDETPQELIFHILTSCEKGKSYFFRGTNCEFNEISSSLYRTYKVGTSPIFNEHFQPVHIEKEIVDKARSQFPDATSNTEILTDLRHFGADTTLIDFSRSLFVALFFACNGEADKDGNLIVLTTDGINTAPKIDYEKLQTQIRILEPARTAQSRARVEFQCSIFIHAPKGVVEKSHYESFRIPKEMKDACRRYLKDVCNIHEQTIYNDLIGFIKNENNFETAAVSFYRGHAAQESGNHECAISHYDRSIKLRPDSVAPYNNRGAAKAKLGNFEAAIVDYDKVIRSRPDDAKAYNNRGAAKAKLGNFEAAIVDYDEVIRLRPDDAKAYYNRGAAKAKLGNFEAAIVDYDKVIRLRPDDAEAYYNRGAAKVLLDKTGEARSDFQKALELAVEQDKQELMAVAQQCLSSTNGPT